VSGRANTARLGDTITLRLPHEQELVGVALLVVGGIGVRLDLTIETLEDLELAVESLLGCVPRGQDTTLEVKIANGSLTAAVSPVDGARVRAELDEVSDAVGLRRVLQTVADRVEVVERDGASWVQIEKNVSREQRQRGQ
jgi:hypothetical protein